MCKSTKGTQAAANGPVAGIQPNVAGGTNGGGGNNPGPDPEAATPAPLLGQPDYAPQLTFIAQASPTDNGFIALAVQFHQNSGLNPITVTSIEEIVDILADSTRSGTGIINRIRIVSHVFFDISGLQQPVNMMLKFLTAGAKPALKRHFIGFSGNGIESLKSMMTFEVSSFSNTPRFFYDGDASTIISFLRPTHNAIVDLVPVDALGEPSSQDFRDFFLICASKWALSQNIMSNAGQTSAVQGAYDILLADVVSRIQHTIPVAQLTTLSNAIIGFGSSHALTHQTPFNKAEYVQNVSATVTAIAGNAFATKLNIARQRFNRNSKIDIRGCQVGRDPDFLTAIQMFFGTSATVRPAVSGPRWFQHFNTIGNITGLDSNAALVGLHNSGFAPYSSTQITQFLNDWCTAFGITGAHLTFWRQTFALNVLSFCALGWRGSIPATRIPVERLQALTTANFSELLNKLVAIFLVPAADKPNAAALTGVANVLPTLGTLAPQLIASIADTATPPQLTVRFNQLKTIYEAVDKRFTTAGGTPTAAQRIIPATEPASLTPAAARILQTQLITFIDTHASSRFKPFKRFIDAALVKAQDAPSTLRYFLCLGLPFLTYDPAATNANINSLVVYTDAGSGAGIRQNDAIKYWIRSHWRGHIPAALGAGTTFENSRQTPWLVENRQPATGLTIPPYVISPTNEFHDKIVTINP